jgi:cell division protein FtsL
MKKTTKTGQVLPKVLSALILISIVLALASRQYMIFKIDLLLSDIPKLEQKVNDLKSKAESRQAAVNRLANIDRITRVAGEQLHMVPNNEQPLVMQFENSPESKTYRQSEIMERRRERLEIAGVR